MRFEAKHKYFKKMAQTLGNFTNIAKSLANRHQRYMCYKMTCSVQFLKVPDTYGPGLLKPIGIILTSFIFIISYI